MSPSTFLVIFHLLFTLPFTTKDKKLTTEWILSNLISKPNEGVHLKGTPSFLDYKRNNAVSFNGLSDAIFIDSMPLAGLSQFTIEVIFCPASGGNFEQRFLHIGETQGDRVLLELRSTPAGWYLDAFVKEGSNNKTLIDPSLLHPSDEWYHIAYVVDRGKLETYVNKEKELEAKISLAPLKNGKTSIGVRQNEVAWFKGAIYKIKITPEALKQKDFMQF
jgi:hypothetical protein